MSYSFVRTDRSFLRKKTERTEESIDSNLLDILDHLRDTRDRFSKEDVKKFIGYDFPMDRIRQHHHFLYDEKSGLVAYKPLTVIEYNCTLSSPDEILKLLANNPSGVRLEVIEDAYLSAKMDMRVLREQKKVIVIESEHDKNHVVFPIDIAAVGNEVDDDIKQLWNEVSMPMTAAELEKELKTSGFRVMSRPSQNTVEVKKRKRQQKDGLKISGKLTNQHMIKQLRSGMNE